MTRAADINDIEVPGLDNAIQVSVDEIQSRRCPPMAQQSRFDVAQFQRLFQKRIIVEINLTHRKIVRRPPVCIYEFQLFFGKGPRFVGSFCFGRMRLAHDILPCFPCRSKSYSRPSRSVPLSSYRKLIPAQTITIEIVKRCARANNIIRFIYRARLRNLTSVSGGDPVSFTGDDQLFIGTNRHCAHPGVIC